MRMIGLYMEFIRIKWHAASQYRGAFLMTAFSKIVGFGAEFATIYILISRFQAIGGWSAPQVLSLFALNQISYALGACFTFHTARSFDQMARNGEMDALLTKPVNPFLYLMANRFSTGYVGNLTISGICLVVGIAGSGIIVSPFAIGMILVAIIGGALIHGSMMLLTSIPSVYMVNVDFRSLFYFRIRSITDYPITIYPTAVRLLLTFVLPYAFISFYPAQLIFGIAPLYHPAFQFLSPVVGIALCLVTYRYFWYAVSKYQGSGT